MKENKISADVRKASMKAAIVMDKIARDANLDPVQQLMMYMTTFVANYYSIRDNFRRGVEEYILQKLKSEMQRLDEFDKSYNETQSEDIVDMLGIILNDNKELN